MAEIIVVTKCISCDIIWRININQLNSAAKLSLERVQSEQVIPLDNQVFV